MGINVTIDETLLGEAERVTGEHDRQKLIEKALRELISRGKPPSLSQYAGQFNFADDYDVIKERGTRGFPD